MANSTTRRAAFRALHESGCFVIPNPNDRGSAVVLAQLGFRALATTSAGFAFSRGLPDRADALSRDEVLAHIADIVESTDLPVNADFQSGYAVTPEGVAESVRLCVEAGVAGLSIEDATGDPRRPLFELDEAVARVRAARRAIDASKTGVLLTARAECFLTGHESAAKESIRRLRAYADAGADVLYAPGLSGAPGLRGADAIAAVVAAVAPKPVNVLALAKMGMTLADFAALGVRRVSVGGALARAAWTGFARAARPIAERGDFSAFDDLLTTADVSRWFDP
jgi:2-methylisocitrate lyase-like PEP mutase family enzyme